MNSCYRYEPSLSGSAVMTNSEKKLTGFRNSDKQLVSVLLLFHVTDPQVDATHQPTADTGEEEDCWRANTDETKSAWSISDERTFSMLARRRGHTQCVLVRTRASGLERRPGGKLLERSRMFDWVAAEELNVFMGQTNVSHSFKRRQTSTNIHPDNKLQVTSEPKRRWKEKKVGFYWGDKMTVFGKSEN